MIENITAAPVKLLKVSGELSSTIVKGLAKDIRYSRDEKNHLEVLL